jgi:hypothetical protein
MAAVCFGAVAFITAVFATTPLTFPAAESLDITDRVITYLVGGIGAAGLIGLLSLGRSIRIEALLSTSPWRKRRYRVYVDRMGNHRPSLVLLAEEGRPEAVLLVSALRWRVGEMEERNGGDILVAGNPLERVILRLPKSEVLLVARRPRIPWWREKMRTWAMDER